MSRETLESIIYEYTQEIGEDMVDNLPHAEQELVRKYFGMFPYQNHSIRQLGISLNIGKSSAWKRLRTIMSKLRKMYRTDKLRATK